MTGLGMMRRFMKKEKNGEVLRRDQKIVINNTEEKTLKCGSVEFQIHVGPGQEINARKMCKKLLKAKYNEINGNEKKFVSKGYKNQRSY